MKRITILLIVALFVAVSAFPQADAGSAPLAIETLNLLPKRGMEDKFEAAVVAHNKKYHADGAYIAGLRKIEYGEKAGWYVWVLGPTAYGTLDKPLGKTNGHEDDWNNTVDPLVDQYGPSGFWNYNADLSYGLDIFRNSKHYETWGVNLKPGQYYRFKELAGKLKKVYESMKTTAFIVVENNLHKPDGADIALIWSFNTYADWQMDPGPKATYEKMYGEGSWQHMIDDWMSMINGYTSEIRSNIK